MILRVGTRTSQLALAQATAAARAIVAACPELDDFEMVGITTKGDVDRAPLAKIGGTGLFTSAVREALLRGDCDIAIHSAKDLPARDHPELALFYPRRVNPADVLCAHLFFAELPAGAKVGTGSPRRAAQLRAARPDLQIVAIRGNVPTRLGRIDDDLDAVVLARAGLQRLGLEVGEDLPLSVMVPAAGQGALGIEAVAGSPFARLLGRIDDPGTRLEVSAERAFMAELGAGCTTPVGVLARSTAAGVTMRARYIGEAVRVDETVSEAALPEGAAGGDPASLPFRLAGKLAGKFIAAGVSR